MSKARYASGTNMNRTNKEVDLDYLERALFLGQEGGFEDDMYLYLKTLPKLIIEKLHNLVSERVGQAHEQERKTILALHLCSRCEGKVKGSVEEPPLDS